MDLIKRLRKYLTFCLLSIKIVQNQFILYIVYTSFTHNTYLIFI